MIDHHKQRELLYCAASKIIFPNLENIRNATANLTYLMCKADEDFNDGRERYRYDYVIRLNDGVFEFRSCDMVNKHIVAVFLPLSKNEKDDELWKTVYINIR